VKEMMFAVKHNTRGLFIFVIFICAFFLIFTAAAVAFYITSMPAPDAAVYMTANNDVNAHVYYIENDAFGKDEMPSGLNYLMSFTDYIDVENSFLVECSKETEITYQYRAVETLVIRQQKDSGGNTDPIVYEKEKLISEKNGSVTGNRVFFAGYDTAIGLIGFYKIDPQRYIDVFAQFVNEQRERYAQTHKEDIFVEKPPVFSAEILVDYTYHIRIDEIGIDETLTRGCRIPLSNEIYSFEYTGAPTFELVLPVREVKTPGVLFSSLFVLWVAMHVAGICCGIWKLTRENNERRREGNKIFKKYSDEIIVLKDPLDLSGYQTVLVLGFRELLKLAVNFGKHILCFHNNTKADFCVVVDGYAYCYQIQYENEENLNFESVKEDSQTSDNMM
jgi:hypothetical protein